MLPGTLGRNIIQLYNALNEDDWSRIHVLLIIDTWPVPTSSIPDPRVVLFVWSKVKPSMTPKFGGKAPTI